MKYTRARAVVDYFIFKSHGVQGFPPDKHWLYGYFNPATVRHMSNPFFFIISAKGPLGIGKSKSILTQVKTREHSESLGVKVEFGERIDYGAS